MVKLGSLTASDGLYIQDVDPQYTKKLISYDIRNYGSIFYDSGVRFRRFTVSAELVMPDGTSIDPTFQKMQSYARRKLPVIFDLTDEYPSFGFLIGVITDFPARLPPGQKFWAPISFTFQLLRPWGTMIVNEDSFICVRDLTWKGDLGVADPTIGVHNFSYNESGKEFKAEFVIWNSHPAANRDSILEFFLPDNIDKFHVESWDGSAWQMFLNDTTDTYDSDKLYYLDGQTATQKWGSGNGAALFDFGERGDTVAVKFGESIADEEITIRAGTMKRVLVYIKYPPKTSAGLQSAPYATRIRITGVYTGDDDTSYSGFEP